LQNLQLANLINTLDLDHWNQDILNKYMLRRQISVYIQQPDQALGGICRLFNRSIQAVGLTNALPATF